MLNVPLIKNGRPHPPENFQDLKVLPNVREACDSLRRLGFILICVTNQPDIARGTASISEVKKINDFLLNELSLTEVLTCIHDDADDCVCRKPKPGLLFMAAKQYDIDLKASYMVGDRWRDIEAGCSAGCKTVFIDWKYAERRPDSPDIIVESLEECVPWIEKSSRCAQ